MHLDRLNSKLVLFATGILVAISLVIVWTFVHLLQKEQNTDSVATLIQGQEKELDLLDSKDLSARVEANVTGETTHLVDPIEDCAETTHEQSEECKQALDAHFLQKQPMHPGLSWITFDHALTYEEIFADPSGDRMRVIAALQRPECRLEEGEAFRSDLKDLCDAQAFASYSKFLETCIVDTGIAGLDQFTREYIHFNDIPFNKEDDSLERNIKLNRTEKESRLETSWLNSKCSEYDLSKLALSPARDGRWLDFLEDIGQHFGEVSLLSGYGREKKWKLHLEPTDVLISLAHRLGAEKTVPLIHRPVYGKGSVEWTEYIQTTHAWIEPWDNLMRSPVQNERVRAAVDVAVALQKTGLSFDWNYLVERACLRYFQEEASCQSLLDEVLQATEWHETQKLQVLDEFETRALQMGIYD